MSAAPIRRFLGITYSWFIATVPLGMEGEARPFCDLYVRWRGGWHRILGITG